MVIVDKRGDRSRALKSLGKAADLTALESDVTDADGLRRILAGADVAVNATLPEHNLRVMEACFDAGCGYVDSAGYSPTAAGERGGVLDQLALDPTWRGRGPLAGFFLWAGPGASHNHGPGRAGPGSGQPPNPLPANAPRARRGGGAPPSPP